MPTTNAQSYPGGIALRQLLSTDNADILTIKCASQIMLGPRRQLVAQHDVYVGVSHTFITIFKYLHDQVLILAGICELQICMELTEKRFLVFDLKFTAQLFRDIDAVILPRTVIFLRKWTPLWKRIRWYLFLIL